MGAPPMTYVSEYSGWQAGGTMSVMQSYRAVGAAAAVMRTCTFGGVVFFVC